MARRRVVYRKKHQNRLSMILIILIVLMLVVVVCINSVKLKKKNESYQMRIEQLEEDIQKEEQRKQDLEEQGKYMKTKKYVEETAREKFGLIYKNEILIQEE